MNRILFTGAHGVGKTTSVMCYAAALKKTYPGQSVKVHEESIRDLSRIVPMESPVFNDVVILDALLKEVTTHESYHHVIYDRAALDGIVYAKVLGKRIPKEYESLAVAQAKRFDKIYHVVSNGRKLSNDGFRNTDKVFQAKLERAFRSLLKKHRIKHETVYVKDGSLIKEN